MSTFELNLVSALSRVFTILRRHRMLSSLSSSDVIFLTTSQRLTNALISWAVCMGILCWIQWLSLIALWSVSFFHFAFRNRIGIMFCAVLPSTHDDVQNVVVCPFPISTTVDAANNAWSFESQCRSNPFHARSFYFHYSQSHLRRRALAKRSKSRIPSPPFLFGVQVGQLIKECPP